MNSVRESAYAKINLYLDVLSAAKNGYHEIRTVMHAVSLCDEIVCSAAPAGKSSVLLTTDGANFLPNDRKNLAAAAAWSFLEYTGKCAAVKIRLKKNIPVAAGLAGGSADAAAVYRALNRIFRRPLTDQALSSLAAALGSDIPFCLRNATALCEGRGEIMTRLPSRLHLYLVIAVAGEHISTASAYATLDEVYHGFDGSVPTAPADRLPALLDGIARGVIPEGSLYNVFEPAVLPGCPGAEKIRRRLPELGATAVLMSGSGPSVYGIFPDRFAALSAARTLTEEGIRAFAAESVG